MQEENVLDTIDKAALGNRLHEARLKRGHSLIAVYDITELPVVHLGAIEQGLTQVTPHELITLAHLYRVQLYQLLNPLPLDLSEEDILGMYCREEISEGVACHELGVDLLDLRTRVKEYQKSSPSEGEGGRTDV